MIGFAQLSVAMKSQMVDQEVGLNSVQPTFVFQVADLVIVATSMYPIVSDKH